MPLGLVQAAVSYYGATPTRSMSGSPVTSRKQPRLRAWSAGQAAISGEAPAGRDALPCHRPVAALPRSRCCSRWLVTPARGHVRSRVMALARARASRGRHNNLRDYRPLHYEAIMAGAVATTDGLHAWGLPAHQAGYRPDRRGLGGQLAAYPARKILLTARPGYSASSRGALRGPGQGGGRVRGERVAP